MVLTEAQIQEARIELARRQEAERLSYERVRNAAHRAEEDLFWAEMHEKFPNVSRDDMYEIYAAYRDFYE